MDRELLSPPGAAKTGCGEAVPYLETPIAALLEVLTKTCGGLALFHIDWPDNLPRAPTSAKLQESVETQLRDETSMDEVYVQWQRR